MHLKDLPGKPDIVLPKYKTVIFVHGCYWHRHPGCKYAYTPKTRVEFWLTKFRENVERDKRSQSALKDKGWRVLIVWECEIQDNEAGLADRLERFLKTDTGEGLEDTEG